MKFSKLSVVAFVILLAICRIVHNSSQKTAIMREAETLTQMKIAGIGNRPMSATMRLLLKNDPEFIASCIVIAETEKWPGLDEEEKQIILCQPSMAKKILGEKVKKKMEKDGARGLEQFHFRCRAPGLSIIFIDLPLARRLKKTEAFLSQYIEEVSGSEKWYEPEVSPEKYQEWLLHARWPFEGEDPAVYDGQ